MNLPTPKKKNPQQAHNTQPDKVEIADKSSDDPEAREIVGTFYRYQGPLPHPEVLAAYEKIQAGAADRIIAMAENHSNAMIEGNLKIIRFQANESRLGQVFAFGIGLFGLTAATISAVYGMQTTACTIAGSTLGSLVLAFLKRNSEREKDNE